MNRKWKVILILTAILLLAFSVSLAWSAPDKVAFTAKDHDVITAFYLHLMGTLAPGTINRSPFTPGIEKALAVGSRVPMQLEKDLMPLPKELESQLTMLTGEYRRFKLGTHVLLVKTSDSSIVDIIKNAGMTK